MYMDREKYSEDDEKTNEKKKKKPEDDEFEERWYKSTHDEGEPHED